jgi:serine O-acetyltransferase
MFSTLLEDLRRKALWYEMPLSTKALLRMCFSDGSTAQILYRAMRFCQTHHLSPLAFIIYRLNAAVGHVIIGRGADFGPGFVILHSFGIVINSKVRAGKNLVLHHGVTLAEKDNLCPILGDNVVIGAGAMVIGPVHIGSDVKIGANAVVLKDVPDGGTVVGVPARLVRIYGKRTDKIGSEIDPE